MSYIFNNAFTLSIKVLFVITECSHFFRFRSLSLGFCFRGAWHPPANSIQSCPLLPALVSFFRAHLLPTESPPMERNALAGPPGGVALPGWNPYTQQLLQGVSQPNLAGIVVEQGSTPSSTSAPRSFTHDPYNLSLVACSRTENDMLFDPDQLQSADQRPSEAFYDRFPPLDEAEVVIDLDDPHQAQPPVSDPREASRPAELRSGGTAAGLRHYCPVHPCKSSYACSQALLNHIESIHLSRSDADVVISESFLSAYSRWLCCDMFMPLNKSCRSCQKRGPRDHCRRP